jgi:ribose transport system ATP-binding protein
MQSPSPPLFEARHITKSFPGVQALADVRLCLGQREVLAVIGENGAGKSTLMKILAGVYVADQGQILLDGKEVRFKRVDDAQRSGIALIHQELNLATNLDIASNIFLGREPTRGGPLRLLRRSIYADALPYLRRLGLNCSPRTPVASLSTGQQQLVEIARALSLNARILIMDEPTSSLTQRETDRLFEVIRELRQSGVSVLYISHRLKEVDAIADRVVVLRDGRNAGELTREEIRHDAMVRLMVGRELKQFFQRTHSPSADARPILEVRGLQADHRGARPVTFALRPGEMVGMAGLMGSGRTELAEALFGIRRWLAGEVRLGGQEIRPRSPRQAMAAGVFLVPEDRRTEGLVLPASVRDNISLPSLDRLSWLRLVARSKERELAGGLIDRLRIRTPSQRQTVGLLSGGNQQKVVLAKWLARTPRVLILDEPTRGVDVGAKQEIYALMDQLAGQGVAILMISSDLEEVLGMSDRVLVMHQGGLAGELPRERLSEEAVMQLATGGESRA